MKVKYYSYNEYTENPTVNTVVTISEEEIIKTYWDFWYGQMCKKFGKEHVDKNYTKQDCVDDWIVINWAWEVEG